ncbi:MAG: cell division protein SepF [Candidatus Zipacnadales bacterium]
MLYRMFTQLRCALSALADKILIILPEEAHNSDSFPLEEVTENQSHINVPDPLVEDGQSGGYPAPLGVIRRGPLTVCLVKPRTINEAAAVGERLRDHMVVVLNLEIEDKAMGQRIFDYMSGAAHVLNAQCERAGRQVYVYVPQDIPIENVKFDQPRERLIEPEEVPLAKAAGSQF